MKAFLHFSALALLGLVTAFPPSPSGLTTIKSRFENGITISYKEPGICETTPGVKSYSGYVRFPIGALGDVGIDENFTINTFFWFFESRKDPANAPLAIWLNGDPGSSSMTGLLTENRPCHVNPDSNSTYLNEWSWNNEVNMLYINQPTQVGFSYDIATNITFNQDSGEFTPTNFSAGVPQEFNISKLIGTSSSQKSYPTANTTGNAARTLWQFAQTWFQEFPGYKPIDNRISLSAESYGGRYGPATFAYFQGQNQKIRNGSLTTKGDIYDLHLDTLGLVQGCINILPQAASYPHMAYNNTYGIRVINETMYKKGLEYWSGPGGCRDQAMHCQALADEGDPNFYGNNATVETACANATEACFNVQSVYLISNRGTHDIAHTYPDPFPPPYYNGFLNTDWVQGALGVPVNFTGESNAVYDDFFLVEGDYTRSNARGYLGDIGYLLDSGVKVAMMYGDRDFECNWLGGENVSLNIDYVHAVKFRSAGYTPLHVNNSYIGGQTRQYGNLSFTRVYESGHEVPAYQPETAYQIFHRAMFNKDIPSGNISTLENKTFETEGPSSVFHIKNKMPADPAPTCYVIGLYATCTHDQINSVLNGSGLVYKDILIDKNTRQLFPELEHETCDNSTGDGKSNASAGDTPSTTGASASNLG